MKILDSKVSSKILTNNQAKYLNRENKNKIKSKEKNLNKVLMESFTLNHHMLKALMENKPNLWFKKLIKKMGKFYL